MEDLVIAPTEKKLLKKTLADLSIKSMLFDMDVDIENLALVPKNDYKEPSWLKTWKEKQRGADYTPSDNY